MTSRRTTKNARNLTPKRRGPRPTDGSGQRSYKWDPTFEERHKVCIGVTMKIPLDTLRKMIISPQTGKPISSKNFAKKFSAEIELGREMIRMNLGHSGYKQAMGSDPIIAPNGEILHPGEKPNPIVTIFLLKAWGGLNDKPEDNTNPDSIADMLRAAAKAMDVQNGSKGDDETSDSGVSEPTSADA